MIDVLTFVMETLVWAFALYGFLEFFEKVGDFFTERKLKK
jgi:hypothetical protein